MLESSNLLTSSPENNENHEKLMKENYTRNLLSSTTSTTNTNTNTNNSESSITLWQFLLELLLKGQNNDCIQWIQSKEGEFKVSYLFILKIILN